MKMTKAEYNAELASAWVKFYPLFREQIRRVFWHGVAVGASAALFVCALTMAP